MLWSVRPLQSVGQFGVVSTVIVVSSSDEGLYLSAVRLGRPMLWMILTLSGMFPAWSDACSRRPARPGQTSSIRKRRRL